MATQPHRRWFQFGLRTMFVVVTVVAVFIGYHVNWIQQRRAARTPQPVFPGSKYLVEAMDMSKGSLRAPGLLWIFGEKGVDELCVVFTFPDRARGEISNESALDEEVEAERIHRLFPEARTFQSKVQSVLHSYH